MMDLVSRLLAIEDIKQLKARYCRFADSGDLVRYAELFAEHALIDVRGATRPSGAASTGTASLSDFDQVGLFTSSKAFVDHIRATMIAGTRSAHHCHNAEVEILSTETARGIFAMADHIWLPENAPCRTIRGFGHYHDEFIRRNGRWLISSLKLVRIDVQVQ